MWEFYVGGYQLLRRRLHDERYRNHWQAKRAWYEKHGFADHLITTVLQLTWPCVLALDARQGPPPVRSGVPKNNYRNKTINGTGMMPVHLPAAERRAGEGRGEATASRRAQGMRRET